jgi:hypothetical protein
MTDKLLAVVSDLHVNSRIALCHPEGVIHDNGQRELPSKAQVWLWERWLEFWDAVRAEAEGRDLIVAVNGDAVDGFHHQTHEIHTLSETTQKRMAERVLEPVLALDPTLWMVRGTEAHVGSIAKYEEDLAQTLGAEKYSGRERWSSYHLRLRVCGNLFDFKHHGRAGYRPWTRPNALLLLAADLTYHCASLPPEDHPVIAFRAHTHVPGDSGDAHHVRVISTPGWQLKTSYTHRLDASIGVYPVGGVIVKVDQGGDFDARLVTYTPDPPTEENA